MTAITCCGLALAAPAWAGPGLRGAAAPTLGAAASARGAAATVSATGTRADAPIASETPLAAAVALLRDNVSIDVHTHGGPEGITSRTARPSGALADGMSRGGIAVLCLADVPDGPILGRNEAGVLGVVRETAPGFLYQHHLDRLDWVDELVAKHGIRRVLTVADIRAAHAAGQPAVIVDIEGLDFLERKLERLEESYRRGVRTMQLVHYTPNDIGDFQTGAITHHGLTELGAEVIRACHRLGVVVDVAHATFDAVKQAAAVSSKPLLLSHTALRGSKAQGATPLTERQITPDHARAIAETDGSIGIWHFFPSLERYVDGLKEMADVVGVDHVSIGTDAAAARGLFDRYDDFTRLVDAMLRGGFAAGDVARIVGGNYLRIFAASVG